MQIVSAPFSAATRFGELVFTTYDSSVSLDELDHDTLGDTFIPYTEARFSKRAYNEMPLIKKITYLALMSIIGASVGAAIGVSLPAIGTAIFTGTVLSSKVASLSALIGGTIGLAEGTLAWPGLISTIYKRF